MSLITRFNILFVITILTTLSVSQTVSIYSLAEFSSALPCVRTCIYCTAGWVNCDDVGVFLGCDYYEPYLDSCWCRQDFYSKATKSLYDCVSAACGGQTRDISSAISMYQGYCAGKDTAVVPTVTQVDSQTITQTTTQTIVGATKVVELTAPQTDTVVKTISIITNTVTTSTASVVTVVIYSAITTTLNSTSLEELASQWKGSRGLQTGDKVAIAIGVIAGVLLLVALLYIVVLQTQNMMMKQQLNSYREPQLGGVQRPISMFDS
ncbi:hypothetical protein TWF970_008018 [Orbilia oligospora]|uniref:Extracellular membrane protein CFEM domain-containing protein n=1 Tax=Orbilia oligospora TaxID=2813651 RepID=A0A7C8R9K5_ORBOL|nr:hypothetical protein TWF970_008018 [Orbilia oligospora]